VPPSAFPSSFHLRTIIIRQIYIRYGGYFTWTARWPVSFYCRCSNLISFALIAGSVEIWATINHRYNSWRATNKRHTSASHQYGPIAEGLRILLVVLWVNNYRYTQQYLPGSRLFNQGKVGCNYYDLWLISGAYIVSDHLPICCLYIHMYLYLYAWGISHP